MKNYCISYKAPDYLQTGFLGGVNVKAASMLQALARFAMTHPDCEAVGALQTDTI